MVASDRTSPRRAGRIVRWPIVLAVGSIVVAGCAVFGASPSGLGDPTPPVASSASAKDFTIGVYQGEDVLGSGEGPFSRVFTQRKPVVLNFWAGQCPPCRAEMPAFQHVADEYAGKVLFVGVDVGVFTGLGTREDARRLLEELGIRYPAAYAVDDASLRLYSVRSMPTTVFLSSAGEIVSTSAGVVTEGQLRAAVQRLAQESGG